MSLLFSLRLKTYTGKLFQTAVAECPKARDDNMVRRLVTVRECLIANLAYVLFDVQLRGYVHTLLNE